MKLLVAVDGSKHSERVVEAAAELAKSTSSEMLVLYVVPDLGVPEEYRKYAATEGIDPHGYSQALGEQVASDMEKRANLKGVKHEFFYEVGVPHLEIIRAAKEKNASVVVVGLHGLHGVGKIQALGSTARRVVENSPVPVLVVPS